MATGEIIESSHIKEVRVLLEGPILGAVTGPWIPAPSPLFNIINFAVVQTDRTDPTASVVAPTSNIFIDASDSVVNPTSGGGHQAVTLSATLTSVNNTGFGYAFYRGRTTAAQPAGLSVIMKAIDHA